MAFTFTEGKLDLPWLLPALVDGGISILYPYIALITNNNVTFNQKHHSLMEDKKPHFYHSWKPAQHWRAFERHSEGWCVSPTMISLNHHQQWLSLIESGGEGRGCHSRSLGSVVELLIRIFIMLWIYPYRYGAGQGVLSVPVRSRTPRVKFRKRRILFFRPPFILWLSMRAN